MDEFNKSLKDASEAMNGFTMTMYKTFNKDYRQLEKISSPEKLKVNEEYFMKIPDEYNIEFIKMLTAGFNAKEAYDLIKETYKL